MKARTSVQRLIDFATFPIRALALHEYDRFGLSSLKTERFDYAAREVGGYCLDVGCGRHNRFVAERLGGKGVGIDVFRYEGLTEDQIVEDMTRLPFPDASFDSVTFLANLNHVPESIRDAELADAYRCLKPGGNIIVTMGNPLVEILVHKLVEFYDRYMGTNLDIDNERGMHEEEDYYLTGPQITGLLAKAGFKGITRKYFGTQWLLNSVFVGRKPQA